MMNNLLSKKQYYLDYCRSTIAEGGVVDTIYLDFAKPFGTVS